MKGPMNVSSLVIGIRFFSFHLYYFCRVACIFLVNLLFLGNETTAFQEKESKDKKDVDRCV